jgi:uncharacterized protein
MSDSKLPPVIQQMMQPSFYPHSVQEPIQLIQTHISYVLLTGEYAYKLKKPINFGFLDFSTLEQRHHFCLEELRLNERGAPGIYLEVLPISQVGDQLHLGNDQPGNDEQPVEYTLKMRQFPQETLLDRMFDQGKLTEELLVELAKAIASFHANSPTSDYVRKFGEVSQVRQAFDENYEQTERYIGIAQTQKQFDETKTYTDRFFQEQQDLFVQRMQQDRIRECHGDLHLGNISFWQNKLFLFDCIEFNEPFRFVDVMYDVAYIVMDMAVRQRPDLGALFLNTYIEQTGDWEGLRVLPIYISRQTYVRAKITSFLLDDPAVPDDAKQKAKETAALYYRLAWENAHPQQGKLILMSGLSGSGKSTTARLLARKLGAVYIRSDAVRKHLAGIPLHQKGGNELYTAEMTQKTYGRLLELGIQLAAQGYRVILDAKYDRQALRAEAIAQSQAHQIPLQIFHCDAPLDVLKTRLQQRTGDIADATADLLAQQQLEPFTEAEQPYVTRLDTTQDVEKQLELKG